MRDRRREFLIEGAIAVSEAQRAGVRLRSIFTTRGSTPPPAPRGRTFEVSEDVMKVISGTSTPPGLVAVAAFVDREGERLIQEGVRFGVVLAGVRDPGNAGTILRSAWAAGADAVFAGPGTADIYNPKVVRSAAGALFNLRVARDLEPVRVLEMLGEAAVRRVAADPAAGLPYYEVDVEGPCAFVFGNEAWGIPVELEGLVDVRACIPMEATAESLNVAVAAALFLFDARRRRTGTLGGR